MEPLLPGFGHLISDAARAGQLRHLQLQESPTRFLFVVRDAPRKWKLHEATSKFSAASRTGLLRRMHAAAAWDLEMHAKLRGIAA